MGKSERLSVDSAGLTEQDVALLAIDGLAPGAEPAPINGMVVRHGQTVSFTLDTSRPAPEPCGMVFEQFAIAALVLTSFIGPIYHLMR